MPKGGKPYPDDVKVGKPGAKKPAGKKGGKK